MLRSIASPTGFARNSARPTWCDLKLTADSTDGHSSDVADVWYGRNGLNQLMPGYLSPIAYEALMFKKTETT